MTERVEKGFSLRSGSRVDTFYLLRLRIAGKGMEKVRKFTTDAKKTCYRLGIWDKGSCRVGRQQVVKASRSSQVLRNLGRRAPGSLIEGARGSLRLCRVFSLHQEHSGRGFDSPSVRIL